MGDACNSEKRFDALKKQRRSYRSVFALFFFQFDRIVVELLSCCCCCVVVLLCCCVVVIVVEQACRLDYLL